MHAQNYCNTSLAKTNTIFLCVYAHWIWHLSYTDFTKKDQFPPILRRLRRRASVRWRERARIPPPDRRATMRCPLETLVRPAVLPVL